MIAKELVDWCENHGKKCIDCPHYPQCESYSELVRNAPYFDLSKVKEVDDI